MMPWFVVALCVSAVVLACSSPGQSQTAPTRAQLDETRAFLLAAPVTLERRAARREKMAIIQAAANQLTPEQFKAYMTACVQDPPAAAALEQDGILSYLARSGDQVFAEVQQARVTKGAVIWHLYNMGYIVKTPETCFGIDLAVPHAARFAQVLDVLLITHEHSDHNSPELTAAMLAAKKPVLTRNVPGSTIVTQAGEYRFGPLRVKVDIGDHHRETPTGVNNMLMYQIDCGPGANHFVIYHSGDGNNPQKMTPDLPVDLFILHVSVNMSVSGAILHIQPKFTMVSHMLELGHSPKPPQAWRWPLSLGYQVTAKLPADQVDVLTWGEHWLAPGTDAQVTGAGTAEK